MKAEIKFIRQIQKTVMDKEFRDKHVKDKKKDFTRNRKLNFSDVIMYTIGNTRNSLGLEAEQFSKYISTDKISGAALCKARQKVKYTAFEELFRQTAVISPRNKCFHGYHLYAVDGMKGELPKTPELTEKYRASKTCAAPVFHAVYHRFHPPRCGSDPPVPESQFSLLLQHFRDAYFCSVRSLLSSSMKVLMSLKLR